MRGGYLRTNYRRSGGMPRLDAIGGGYPYSSQATLGKTAGCGTTDPYGGFIWLSWTGACTSNGTGASVAGISSRWVESTYGLMQSYFGDGAYDSGYAFLPVFVHILSFSDRVMSAGEHRNAVDASLGFMPITASHRTSGSYAIFTPLMMKQIGASLFSWTSLCQATVTVQVGGFIVSTPYT